MLGKLPAAAPAMAIFVERCVILGQREAARSLGTMKALVRLHIGLQRRSRGLGQAF